MGRVMTQAEAWVSKARPPGPTELVRVRSWPIRALPPPESSTPPTRRRWRFVVAGVVIVLAAGLVRITVAPLHLPVRGMVANAFAEALGTPVHVEGVGVRLSLSGIVVTLEDVRRAAQRIFGNGTPTVAIVGSADG